MAQVSFGQAAIASLKPGNATRLPPSVSFREMRNIVGVPNHWKLEVRYEADAELDVLHRGLAHCGSRQRAEVERLSNEGCSWVAA
jgi:hypothetical protein